MGIGRFAATRLARGQQRLDQLELGVRQVACIARADDGIFFSIGLVPGHGKSLVLLQSKRIAAGEADQPFQCIRQITI